MNDDLIKKAIAANIEALRAQLSDCFLLSSEASSLERVNDLL